MPRLFYDTDAAVERLQSRPIAIIGYGSQGHAHALNLTDSGFDVRVGLRPGSNSRTRAAAAGLRVRAVSEAVDEAEIIMLLTPDTGQAALYCTDILPRLTAGKSLMFAHGFNIRFGRITPPAQVDVTMVAPKAPGHRVREVFVEGGGVPALVAIHQDASGHALDDALAYAKGIGCTRAGVLLTTFAEETETDLFGEQAVLCGGVSSLVKAGFETLVEAGYQPEVAYFECMHELKLIVDLLYQGGLNYMRYSVSDTAEYGDYVAGPRIVDERARAAMRELLAEIRDGSFARGWIEENASGGASFTRRRQEETVHEIERVGRELRRMMPFVHPKEVVPGGGGRMTGDPYVRIFDTTLRDGEQAPGCTMTRDEKLAVARQLALLRVDVIEAGFPAASPGDWDAVHAVAQEVGAPDGPTICALARANERDIDRCNDAIAPAARRRIHTFIATSDVHLEHKLRMSRARVAEVVAAMVTYARARCEEVEFSPEDAGRSDPVFLREIVGIAIECGATILNIPDTVGYTTPDEYAAMIAGIRTYVPGAENVVLSTHCHDDLGLAVANSLAGVRAGARQVECTINGIGERAGNASLEEVVMALCARSRLFGVETGIETREIMRTSRLVSACTGIGVPPNKAIVGGNAFAHEAGIHQDGMLKNPLTYEIMRGETVGWDGSTLVLGKHSGRHALRCRLEALGHQCDDASLDLVFARFKEVADRKKVVNDVDLAALLSGVSDETPTITPVSASRARLRHLTPRTTSAL